MDAPASEDTEKVNALRAAIGTVPAWCDDACLRRYLRARSGSTHSRSSFSCSLLLACLIRIDVKHAEEMLRASIKWRAETQPEKISYDEVKPVLDLKTLYLNGHDRQGRPVVYVKPGAQNPYPPELRLRALLFILETAVRIMPPNVEQLVWILDFSEYSFRGTSAESKQVSKQSMELLQNHYPERLGLSLVVSPPWFFTVLFTIVSPFMNAVTRSKIHVVSGSGEKLKKGLLVYIAEDQLEVQYGGTNPNGYSPPPGVQATPGATPGSATAAATADASSNTPDSAAGGEAPVTRPPAASDDAATPKVLTAEQAEEKQTKSYLNMDVD